MTLFDEALQNATVRLVQTTAAQEERLRELYVRARLAGWSKNRADWWAHHARLGAVTSDIVLSNMSRALFEGRRPIGSEPK